ncbi:hypothetical protein [Methanobacterium congolense]|jgi:hypothetical protein|uniref:Uncharacterized protein n=1 Tax=Methanobacterium congolense TaxID=118062 RepID=A0A1D3L473_9EURY|nr:hypothetical protein [Methanobacterium congolense]SCG86358.1 putative protein [Methanobacterium congolense]
MTKTLDIVMAGVISGLVAYTTTQLGIGGTVIGAVLGSMLYQLMTHLFKEPLEGVEAPTISKKIVYIFPLIVIVLVELIYMLSTISVREHHLFYMLENMAGGNLFRSIGFGLLIMGIYPFIQPKEIKKEYGYIIIAVALIKLWNGFSDLNTPITDLYSLLYSELGILISLMVILALSYVILAIAKESIDIVHENEREKEIGRYNE